MCIDTTIYVVNKLFSMFDPSSFSVISLAVVINNYSLHTFNIL